jgi:hypothetical protein
MHTISRRGGMLFLTVAAACSTSEARPENTRARAPSSSSLEGVSPRSADVPLLPSRASYPWSPNIASGRLDGRFRSPPAGFVRVPVSEGSFAEFLRTLPLQPEGAPVVDFRGHKLHADGKHPNIVAVADLDIGSKDLQHCADAIIRLHAEWRYGRGDRDIAYRSVSGQRLSYRGYVAGDRAKVNGSSLVFERSAAPHRDDHALFRGWLDDVFSWAGTASLERDGMKVASSAEMSPGDFFVMSGSPFGHAVLVLDVSRDEHGRTAVLLGQSYIPAQSFQVLARDGSAWFVVERGDAFLNTPFWRPFPMSALRRFG